LIVAPGYPLVGQDRTLANTNFKICGGNYDAKNYLDTYNSINAIAGEVNYFSGNTNNREAPNTNNKKFVLVNNDYYNDQFIYITVDDIFDPLIKRSDFIDQVNLQLNNAADDIDSYSVEVNGVKGTDSIDCTASGIKTDSGFCINWSEMFLLKENAIVNGVGCSKVFIFGGKRTGGQTRVTVADKNDPANYLEGGNLDAFENSGVGNFTGVTTFEGENPTADVLKCIS